MRPASGGLVTLAVLGRLEPDKHYDDVVTAIALLRQGGVNARLRVIGSGSQLPSLRQAAAVRGISDHVDFLGSQRDARAALAGADVLAVTSEAETFGLSPLEAMAAGIAVVAYPMRGGINSWMKDGRNAVVCSERSPSSLAHSVRTLQRDTVQVGRLREGGLATARAFSASNMARETLRFYRRVCGSTARTSAIPGVREGGDAPASPGD